MVYEELLNWFGNDMLQELDWEAEFQPTPKIDQATQTDEVADDEPDENQFEVEKIEAVRKRANIIEFLLKWKGFGPEENSWEPLENLNCPELLEKFIEKLGQKKRKQMGLD